MTRPDRWVQTHVRGGIGQGLLLLALGLGLGFLLRAVGPRATGELAVTRGLVDRSPSWLVDLAAWYERASDPMYLVIVIFGALAVPVVRHGWLQVPRCLLVIAPVWLSSPLVKLLVDRPRPSADGVDGVTRSFDSAGYPSGHVVMVIVLLVLVGWVLGLTGHDPRPALVAVVPMALVAGFLRMVVGAHYLGDVVGALLVAGGVAMITWDLARGLR